MKKLTVIFFLLFKGITGFAQNLSVGLSYNYIYSKQYDKSIQSYNFSRPFLEHKQPLFMHGITSDISYIFKNGETFKHGIHVSYSFFGSKAINQNYSNYLHLHLVDLNYVIRLENRGKFKELFEEINLGASTSGLYRRINGEAFLVDDEKSKSMGIGVNIGVKVGYHLFKHPRHQLSPFVFYGYTPYLYAPKNEALINATQTLITKPYLNAMSFRLGFVCEFIKKKQHAENTDTK